MNYLFEPLVARARWGAVIDSSPASTTRFGVCKILLVSFQPHLFF